MNVFRNKLIKIVFLVVTGLTFFNMSFFLAEVSALKTAYGKTQMENIARLFTASLAEEETDHGSAEEGQLLKETDFLEGHVYHLQFETIGVANLLKSLRHTIQPHGGYLRIFTPPPDIC
jgi:hypothetical protein